MENLPGFLVLVESKLPSPGDLRVLEGIRPDKWPLNKEMNKT